MLLRVMWERVFVPIDSCRNRVFIKSLLIKYFVWLEEETKRENSMDPESRENLSSVFQQQRQQDWRKWHIDYVQCSG